MASVDGDVATLTWHQDRHFDVIRGKSGARSVGTVVQDRIISDPAPFIWSSSIGATCGRAASIEEAKRQVELAWQSSPRARSRG